MQPPIWLSADAPLGGVKDNHEDTAFPVKISQLSKRVALDGEHDRLKDATLVVEKNGALRWEHGDLLTVISSRLSERTVLAAGEKGSIIAVFTIRNLRDEFLRKIGGKGRKWDVGLNLARSSDITLCMSAVQRRSNFGMEAKIIAKSDRLDAPSLCADPVSYLLRSEGDFFLHASVLRFTVKSPDQWIAVTDRAIAWGTKGRVTYRVLYTDLVHLYQANPTTLSVQDSTSTTPYVLSQITAPDMRILWRCLVSAYEFSTGRTLPCYPVPPLAEPVFDYLRQVLHTQLTRLVECLSRIPMSEQGAACVGVVKACAAEGLSMELLREVISLEIRNIGEISVSFMDLTKGVATFATTLLGVYAGNGLFEWSALLVTGVIHEMGKAPLAAKKLENLIAISYREGSVPAEVCNVCGSLLEAAKSLGCSDIVQKRIISNFLLPRGVCRTLCDLALCCNKLLPTFTQEQVGFAEGLSGFLLENPPDFRYIAGFATPTPPAARFKPPFAVTAQYEAPDCIRPAYLPLAAAVSRNAVVMLLEAWTTEDKLAIDLERKSDALRELRAAVL